MTQPAQVLDAIVRTLKGELEPPSPGLEAQTVDVRSVDDLSVDVFDTKTFRAPAVVVSATSMGQVGRDLGPLTVEMTFVARCYARSPTGPVSPGDSRGDVAMNLAALVAQTVEARGIWVDSGGAPAVVARATGLRVANQTTRPVAERGHALWTVTWSQQVELTSADQSALFHAFRTLDVGIGGDVDDPDERATMTLEGREP